MNLLIDKIIKLFNEANIKGECDNISDIERLFILEDLSKIINREEVTFCKYRAIKYTGLSRALFDNLRREGILPKGIKELGGTLRFKKSDLDNYIRHRNDKKDK